MAGFLEKMKKIGQDDPRKIIHSGKVGLALTIVSLFYYFRPLYNGFGQSALWAVLTVVVVFEFTVGATLSKCLNRGTATLVAGALGVGANYMASLCGKTGEPIILGILVFILAAMATFTRFVPQIKQRYDYGIVIFILTFSLVTVSGYRVNEIVELAHQRLSTILIGVATCMIIAIFLWPVWAGEDLHNLVAGNIQKLATFLEGLGGELYNFRNGENSAVVPKEEKSNLQGYESVLNSKATEESLANLAWWEPAHGRFDFGHPWKQYLKIGALTQQCAYHIEALNSCIKYEPQAPSEIRRKVLELSTRMSSEAGKALREMATAMNTMTHHPYAIAAHVRNSKSAIDELKSVLESIKLEENIIMEIVGVVAMASILIEIIKCVERISESLEELSTLAHFKHPKSPSFENQKNHILHRGTVEPVNDDSDHVTITVRGTFEDSENSQVVNGGERQV